MRIHLLRFVCMVALLMPALGLAAEKRVALVIGNSSYTNSPLKNPVNDAKDIATKLRGLGFEVIERNNLTTKQIGGTLREFRSKLAPGAVALVFYAGHGLQIKGDNYLPAVDADINSEEDVPNQSIAMRQIMDVLDESKSRLNLVFLDACRNNPYARSFRSSDRGLARVNAPSGTLISYATKPGSVAADGTGRNGLYTSKLLAQLDSNLQIELALKRVVTEVKTASKGKQEPWMEGSIEGDFCFGGCGSISTAPTQPAPATAPSPRVDSETEAWNIVKETTDVEVVRDFLKEYPKGKYTSPARLKLKELENKAKVTMPPRPQISKEQHTQAKKQRIPSRPQFPFSLREEVWQNLESSEAYRNWPKPREYKKYYQYRVTTVYDSSPDDINPIISEVSQENLPISEKCSKNIFVVDGGTTSNSYGCAEVFYIQFLGGEPTSLIKALELQGSLFPIKLGAEQSSRIIMTFPKSPGIEQTTYSHRKVVSRGNASDLHPKLAGTAWLISTETTTSQNNVNTNPAVYEDYYLEDLGVFMSQIGYQDGSKNRYILPPIGHQSVFINVNGRTTTTILKYDWSLGK